MTKKQLVVFALITLLSLAGGGVISYGIYTVYQHIAFDHREWHAVQAWVFKEYEKQRKAQAPAAPVQPTVPVK